MAKKRVELISSHINSYFPALPYDDSLDEFRQRSAPLDKELCKSIYIKDKLNEISRAREHFATVPVCTQTNNPWGNKEKARTLQIDRLASTYFLVNPSYEIDMQDPVHKFITTAIYTELDQSTATLSIVHITLYVDALQNMGTEKHRDVIDKAYSLEEIGCLAITELGHGSNVSKLETTATYDHATRSFILNSPTATAAKWWIGGLSKNAVRGVFFANLIINDENMGIHAFVVPVRDENYDVLPGLVIGDCGDKIDLNGVDNGFILFKNFSVPYDCLLDRYSQISETGEYQSAITNKEKRLGVLLSSLIRGRIGVIYGSETNLRSCLTIAIRYAAVRRQFSEGPDKELRLIDYPLHKWRLISHVARMMAIRFIGTYLLGNYRTSVELLKKKPNSSEIEEYHALLSAAKAIASWYSITGIQATRESLGGHGYSSYAGVGRIRNGQDMHTTWEGDNTVLMQQTAKFVLKNANKKIVGKEITNESVKFLNPEMEQLQAFKFNFSSTQDLRNQSLLVSLLEYRVNYLAGLSLDQMKNSLESSENFTEAWNKSQVFFLQNLSRAFGELQMAKAFWNYIPETVNTTTDLFRKCFYLYCLLCVHESLALFLEYSINASQARVIEKALTELVNEIGNLSVHLFDAIGIEDFLHGSVLGRQDGQVYAEIIKRAEADPDCYKKAGWVNKLLQIRETGKNIRTK